MLTWWLRNCNLMIILWMSVSFFLFFTVAWVGLHSVSWSYLLTFCLISPLLLTSSLRYPMTHTLINKFSHGAVRLTCILTGALLT